MNSHKHLILHLPITESDIKEYESYNNILTYDPKITIPQPLGYDFKSTTLEPIPYNSDTKFQKLECKIEEDDIPMTPPFLRHCNDENKTYHPIHINWGQKTNLHCWWCCYPFETSACKIPVNNRAYGCFCSLNCCLAYANVHFSFQRWHIVSNIKQLHNQIHPGKDLKSAPPRESLKIFGGCLNIQDFRKNFTELDKEYAYIYSPFKAEPAYIKKINKTTTSDMKNNDGLVLKRTRRIKLHQNSLECTMGIINQ